MATITQRPSKYASGSSYEWNYPGRLCDSDLSTYTYIDAKGKSCMAFFYYDFSSIPYNAVITDLSITIKYRVSGTLSFRLCKDSPDKNAFTYTQLNDTLYSVYNSTTGSGEVSKTISANENAINAINNDIDILRSENRFSVRLFGNRDGARLFVYDIPITITYTVPYTITTAVSPSGGGTVSGGGTYNDGTNVTLTATPATGYQFTKWQKNGADDGNTSATRTITVSEDAAYTAVFTKKTYTISKSLSHATLSNSNATIQHGSSYSSSVTADAGYAIDAVTITMGGTNITSTAYSNGAISIASVTGNISITVTTVSSRLPEIASVSCVPNPANAGQGLVLTVVFS